jgi:hypothetical protein
MRTYFENKKHNRADEVAQAVQHMHENLSSNPSTTRKKGKKETC